MHAPDDTRKTDSSKPNIVSTLSQATDSGGAVLELPTHLGVIAGELVRQAVESNKEAKMAVGRARRMAYQKKAAALSMLLLLNHAEVDSVTFCAGQVTLGLTLAGGVSKQHSRPEHLSDDAREVALRQVDRLLERVRC